MASLSASTADDDDSSQNGNSDDFRNALMNVPQAAPLPPPMRVVSVHDDDQESCVSEITSFSISSLHRGSLYPGTGSLDYADCGFTESTTANTRRSSAGLLSRESSTQTNISQTIGSCTLASSPTSVEAPSPNVGEANVFVPSMESKEDARETRQSTLPPLIEEEEQKDVLDTNRLRLIAALFPETKDGEPQREEPTTVNMTCIPRVPRCPPSTLPPVIGKETEGEQLVGNDELRLNRKGNEPVPTTQQPAHAKETMDNSSTSQSVSDLLSLPAASHATIGIPAISGTLPQGPGAYSMSVGGTISPTDDATQNNNGVLEMANLQQPLGDSEELTQAWPVSDPVIVATPHHGIAPGLGENSVGGSSWLGKKPFKAALVVLVAILVSVVASLNALPQLISSDPNKIEHLQMKETIVNAVREDYFDNSLKEKALHWIVYEDPRHALSVKETSHHSNLIQRFALVSLHLQTSSQQPWAYCNPPVGTQSDTCYYNENPINGGKYTEAMAKRWLTSAHECEWMGVGCSEGIVTQLNLNNKNMTGNIPADEIAMLTRLKDLFLECNNLSGPLPKRLFEGGQLERIVFLKNSLTGSIPSQAFSVPTLTAMRFAANQLTGSIPKEIGQLVEAIYFDFEMNLLTGPIPEEIYTATKLKTLTLNKNLLTGALPSAIGLLQDLTKLSINGNSITGSIPSEIGQMDLRHFRMGETNVGGTIPEELYRNRRLSGLVLSNCQLSGTISENIHHLSNLKELYVNGNANLTGSIPDKLCSVRHQWCNIAADCTPTTSKGVPTIFCPDGCCSTCCDADTKICLQQ